MNSPNSSPTGTLITSMTKRWQRSKSDAYTPVQWTSAALDLASVYRQFRHTIQLCLTILITLGATAPQAGAVVCLSGPPPVPEERAPQAVTDKLNVLGNNPLVPNKKRVRTHRYTDADGTVGRIRGGDYSAVAVDRILYNGEKGQNSSTGNAGSTGNSRTVNGLVSALNQAAGAILFVAGHLVNHEFGGNKADQANFTALTKKTNTTMEGHGESVAKKIMDRIDSNYPSEQYSWVATEGNKKYKVGILYETEIVDSMSIAEYEAQHGNGALISNPNISTTLKSRMAATFETKLRFIIHEYEPNGRYMKANGKWYDMPQSTFDAPFDPKKPMGPTIGETLIGGLLPGTIDPHTGSGVIHPANNAVTIEYSDYGREIKWVYTNRDN